MLVRQSRIADILIVLQGYMYLTNTHICFFAHIPSREVRRGANQRLFCGGLTGLQDQVLKSGTLNKKAQRTKRWNKHWFVLKDDVLSWYHSSSVRLLRRSGQTIDKQVRTRTSLMVCLTCVTPYHATRKERRVCG